MKPSLSFFSLFYPAGSLAFTLLSVAIGAASLGGCSADSGASGPPAGGPGGGTNGATGGTNPMGGTGPGGATNPGGAGHGQGGTTAQGTGGSGAGTGQALFGTDPNRNQVPKDQVCDRVATIQCAGEAMCCGAPGRSFDDCKSTMKQGCVDQLYLDAITSNPVSGYDEGAAVQIFTDYETKASQCDTGVTAWGASPDGLRGLPKGTLNGGASCMPPIAQLANKPTAAAYLAACKNPGTTACLPTITTWTCSPRANAGGPCFTDANCNDGLYCDNPQFALTGGQCKTRKADGTSCALLNECQSLLCKHSQCVPVNKDNAFCLNAN